MVTKKDKPGLEELLCDKAGEGRIPLSGNLELLPLCNMNCDMCYVRLSREEMEQQGNIHTAEEWIELAKQMQKAGTLFLQLTGGEPFLFPEFCRLYLELQKLGFILTINTNGTLIDDVLAEFLGTNKPRRVNITLYGSSDRAYREVCHYPEGFTKTIRGIRLLKERGVDVKLNGTLVKRNKDDWKQLIEIARSLDVPIKIDTYMYPAERERKRPFDKQVRLSPEEAADAWIDIFQEQNGKDAAFEFACENIDMMAQTLPGKETPGCMRCRAGRSSFIVNWQGKMQPCIMMSEPSVPVFEMGFEKAWSQIVKDVDAITLNPKCSGCTLRNVCSVCAASTVLETGDYHGTPEYICRYIQHIVKRQKYLLKATLHEAEESDGRE